MSDGAAPSGGGSQAPDLLGGGPDEAAFDAEAVDSAATTEGPLSGSAPFAAALACLPGAGPATLAALLQEWTPEEAWRRIRQGRLVRPRRGRRGAGQPELRLDQPPPQGEFPTTSESDLDRSWQDAARQLDPPGWWAGYAVRGIGVTWIGHPAYPVALTGDPEPAGVLFWTGSLRHLQRPGVAIVGTRRATPDGRSVAFEMGRDLAAAGICVLSGLALGIDGAAHAGALRGLTDGDVRADRPGCQGPGRAASPAGIAASGVDVPYPRRHRQLWGQVAACGVILSETPPGRPAQAWRFPARNRIIAALSRMVVVVESHQAGGSLITAEAAILRGIDVRAVPGPVRSSASAGTNQLLHDGPAPVRNAQDVLDGLGIFLPGPAQPRGFPGDDGTSGGRPRLDGPARAVFDALLWRPSSLNQIMERSQVSVAVAARALDSLEAAGWVQRHGDWWVRRAPRSRAP